MALASVNAFVVFQYYSQYFILDVWIVIKLDVVCYSLGMRGSTPLDVAAASCIDNNELALALQEQDLEMVNIISLQNTIIVQNPSLLH